jgi:hypothetical protein
MYTSKVEADGTLIERVSPHSQTVTQSIELHDFSQASVLVNVHLYERTWPGECLAPKRKLLQQQALVHRISTPRHAGKAFEQPIHTIPQSYDVRESSTSLP